MKTSKTFYVVLSILAAIFLWRYVDSLDQTPATITVRNIPIEFVGESDVLASRNLMMAKAESNVVTLELQGQRTVISHLNKKDIRVVIDLGRVTSSGTQSLVYDIYFPDSVSQSSVTVKSASIYTVTVDIVPLFTKTVGVKGVLEGQVAEGYSAKEFILSPDTLEVSGQEQDVMQVAYAQVTMRLDDVKETTTQVLDVEMVGYDGQVLSQLDLRPSNEKITATLPIVTIKTLPLKVNFLEGPGSTENLIKYDIEPKSITVSGDAASLSSIESIVLATIDLRKIEGDESKTFAIPLPAGSELLSGVAEAMVTIDFQGVSTKSFTVTNISASRLTDGFRAAVTSTSLYVTLRGPMSDLEKIAPENIRVVADLSSIQATGSYTVAANVYVDGFEQVGAVGEYEVTVKITGAKK